jgi:uncharacterized membrane protein YphA (DoxX/SURF4 family)
MDIQHFIGTSLALLVAGTLLIAGIAKLRQRQQTIRSFRDLGLPAPQVLALAVPIVEVAIAILVVFQLAIGSVVACALLTLFTLFLGARLRRGDAISCGCFGSSSSTPVTSLTVVRNLMLIVAACAAALLTRGFSLPGRAPADWLATATAGGTIGLIAALIIGLMTIKTTIGAVFSPPLFPAAVPASGPGDGVHP